MNNSTTLLDPTDERQPANRQRHAPLDTLSGKTVALLDIGKARGDVFINQLEARFEAAGISTRRYMKPTNTRNAPAELNQQIAAETDAVVEALSD